MTERITVGVFHDLDNAEMAIKDLKNAGVDVDDISYVYSSENRTVVADAEGTTVGEAAASGAGTGAVIGGLAGLAVAAGVLPGLGALLIAGPLAAALGLTGAVATTAAGALTGAAAGTLVGALIGLGVGEPEAKVYEERVKKGEVLVVAKSDAVAAVKEIFDRYNAEEVREY